MKPANLRGIYDNMNGGGSAKSMNRKYQKPKPKSLTTRFEAILT